jgi:two-component system phosphate regulon sensor histidine kinase PhoR
MAGLWIRVGMTALGILLFAWVIKTLAGGHAAFVVAFGCLVVWVVFQLWHLQKLNSWLRDFRLAKTPRGLGTWDILYSAIYRLAKSYERQQAQLKTSLESFRSATEAMPDGVIALDSHNQITYASDRACRHVGIRVPADYGRSLLNILRHPDFGQYLEGKVWDQPVVLKNVPTIGRVLQVQVVPYGQSDRLALTRDITQIDKLETMRQDFVANVSHELRTPLTVVAGYVETLQTIPMTDDQRGQVLQTMGQQTSRMQALIEDLLALSKLESEHKPNSELAINMMDMLTRLAHDAEQLSRGTHQVVVDNQAPTVQLIGDAQELASAFGNLVTNAIRYTPAGGTVTLSWTLQEGGQAAFSVTDTGPGIEAQHIGRLTERFYRVDKDRSRVTGGTGLGLAIVKHVAARHEAKLDIQSTVGQGSRFTLIFPESRVALI